jgi:hypothetical protein
MVAGATAPPAVPSPTRHTYQDHVPFPCPAARVWAVLGLLCLAVMMVPAMALLDTPLVQLWWAGAWDAVTSSTPVVVSYPPGTLQWWMRQVLAFLVGVSGAAPHATSAPYALSGRHQVYALYSQHSQALPLTTASCPCASMYCTKCRAQHVSGHARPARPPFCARAAPPDSPLLLVCCLSNHRPCAAGSRCSSAAGGGASRRRPARI